MMKIFKNHYQTDSQTLSQSGHIKNQRIRKYVDKVEWGMQGVTVTMLGHVKQRQTVRSRAE